MAEPPLKKFYTFLFVDCLYVTIRKDYETKNCAVCVILGYDADGQKDILGLWLSESESKHQWMQIFDEIKSRGVEDVLYILSVIQSNMCQTKTIKSLQLS